MSKTLGAEPTGKSEDQIQITIELRLRVLSFKEREDFTPKATQMGLSAIAFEKAMRVRELLPRYPGKWETAGRATRASASAWCVSLT
jgi:hypothetical protein